MTPENDDRTAWYQAWASMPHRRLPEPPKIDLRDFGKLVDVTISTVPPEYSDKLWMATETCPICGNVTKEGNRIPASLHPKYSTGFSYGMGVWIHNECFEKCPLIDDPTPIPW